MDGLTESKRFSLVGSLKDRTEALCRVHLAQEKCPRCPLTAAKCFGCSRSAVLGNTKRSLTVLQNKEHLCVPKTTYLKGHRMPEARAVEPTAKICFTLLAVQTPAVRLSP